MKTNVFLDNSFHVYLNEGKPRNRVIVERNYNKILFYISHKRAQKSVFIWLGGYPVFEKNVTYSFHPSFKVR